MIQYIIAGAIGFVVAKLLEDDETPKYADGGSVNNSDYTGNYRDLRDFINSNNLQDLFVDNYKKYVSELNKDNWEDYTYGELGYDEEIISSIIGKNYKIFYDEENDEFVITKKKLNKISFDIILSTKKYNDRLIKVIEDNGVYTEYKPRYVVLVKENVIGGSTFEIDDNNIYHFDLAIDEEYQGYGIAKKLIDKIVQDAENLKAKQIQAYVVNNVLFEYLKNSGWNVSKDGGEKYAWKQIRTDNFEKGGSVLLAPNGNPSNLTPEQYKLVRTPEFKAWFGDWEKAYETGNYDNVSKVIAYNMKGFSGEPLICSHSSYDKFNQFKTPTFFQEGEGGGAYGDRSDEDYVNYNVFLNIKNPLELRSSFLKDKFTPLISEIYKNAGLDDDEYKNRMEFAEKYEDGYGLFKLFEKPYWKNEYGYNWEWVFDYCKKNGYDGFVMRDSDQSMQYYITTWVALYPEQIKLADGTNTTFDGNNPDIRFEDGGSVSKNVDSKLKELGFVFNNSNYRYGKTIDEQDYITAFYDKTKGLYKIRGTHKFKTPLGENSVGIQYDFDNEKEFYNKINEYLLRIQ